MQFNWNEKSSDKIDVDKQSAESICTHYSKLSGRPDIFLGWPWFSKQE